MDHGEAVPPVKHGGFNLSKFKRVIGTNEPWEKNAEKSWRNSSVSPDIDWMNMNPLSR